MESIVVALIGSVVTLAGVVLSNSRGRAVMEVKIDELSRRIEKHNSLVERRRRLGADYAAVQARVNEILGGGSSDGSASADVDALACAVIRGDYGNGKERKRRLDSSCAAAQRRANEMLSRAAGARRRRGRWPLRRASPYFSGRFCSSRSALSSASFLMTEPNQSLN